MPINNRSMGSIPKGGRSAATSAAAGDEFDFVLGLEPYRPTGDFITDFCANCQRLGITPNATVLKYARWQVRKARQAAGLDYEEEEEAGGEEDMAGDDEERGGKVKDKEAQGPDEEEREPENNDINKDNAKKSTSEAGDKEKDGCGEEERGEPGEKQSSPRKSTAGSRDGSATGGDGQKKPDGRQQQHGGRPRKGEVTDSISVGGPRTFGMGKSATTPRSNVSGRELNEVDIIDDVIARGCDLDTNTCLALSMTLRMLTTLKGVKLWRNALSEEAAETLLRGISGSSVVDLAIDWNPLPGPSVVRLLQPLFHLRTLSLRGNGLDDSFAVKFAEVLEHNGSLTSLNLWGNKIGDEGACALAQLLTKSTSLHCLSLANNDIGDEGISEFCSVLGRSELPESISELLTKRQAELEESKSKGRLAAKKRKMRKDDPLREIDVENAIFDDGLWFSAGNRSLVSLNLCRNTRITALGSQALWELEKINPALKRLVFDAKLRKSQEEQSNADEADINIANSDQGTNGEAEPRDPDEVTQAKEEEEEEEEE